MTHILITGSKGQLGLELTSLGTKFPQYKFFLTDKNSLNIVDFKDVESFILKNEIDIIVNCAAYTNVDKAEDEPDLANGINNLAVRNLAKIAKKFQLKLIHISTDYVFDGNSNIPYIELDKTNPQNIYGNTKLNGEKALIEINPSNSIIIRTSWVYSPFGANFVKTMLRLSAEKEQISVVFDQIGSPTYANDLANAIMQSIPLIQNKGVEIYHYTNKGECSWHQFAEEIVKLAQKDCIVLPIPSEEFKTKAKRPRYSLLNTEKIKETFQITIPYWKDSLKVCMEKLEV